MKNLPAPLFNYLLTEAARTCYKAHLFQIALPNGLYIRATDFQQDLFYGGFTYYATLYGSWARSTVTTAIGTGSNSCDVTITQVPAGALYPGTSTPLLQVMAQGGLDLALLTIYCVYMPSAGDTSLGAEVKFVGEIGQIQNLGRTQCQFQVNDLMYRLNMQMPKNLINSGCRHVLYHSNCTVNPAAFQELHTAGVGSLGILINLNSAVSHALSYFAQGLLTFTSGLNQGLSATIRQMVTSSQVQIQVPFLFPISTGDAITLLAGCDHTLATCNGTFGNQINFGGMPFVSAPETIL